MKRAIIIGATSGIGEEVAKLLIQQGWHIGIAGRREEALEKLQATAPGTNRNSTSGRNRFGCLHPAGNTHPEVRRHDLFFLSSGIGSQNPDLKPEIELNTARTNVEGFTRMVTAAFNHFKTQGGGHIAVISSIAGTKGLGIRPGLFRNETLPEYLHRSLGTTLPDATLEYPFHRHTPGFRRYRLTEKW